MNVSLFLETLNGMWALMALMFLLFLGIYHTFPLAIRFEVPTGREVARVLGAMAGAELITRSTVWTWRFFYKAGEFQMWQLTLLGFAAMLGGWAFLCAIRLYSRPFFGNVPWVMSLLVVLVYGTTNLFFRNV